VASFSKTSHAVQITAIKVHTGCVDVTFERDFSIPLNRILSVRTEPRERFAEGSCEARADAGAVIDLRFVHHYYAV
jgi:hypothetical protein